MEEDAAQENVPQKIDVPKMDWGSLPPLLLKHVGEAMRGLEEDMLPAVKSARLVNRHWCRWATEMVTMVALSSHMPLQQLAEKLSNSFTGVQKLEFRQGVEPIVAGSNPVPEQEWAPWIDGGDGQHALDSLQGLSNLGHLEFGKIFITDSDVEQLGVQPDLMCLDLRLCKWISDAGLAHVAMLSSLTRLELCSCMKSITDGGLHLLTQLSRLRHLRLQNLHGITIRGVVCLTTLTGLKHLSLLGLSGIATPSVFNIGPLMALETLEVVDCKRISLQGLHHVTGLQRLTCTAVEFLHANEALTDLKFLSVVSEWLSPPLGELLAAIEGLMDLEHLRFRGSWVMTSQCWASVGEHKSLKCLSFERFRDSTEAGVVHCANLANLECLDLNVGSTGDGRIAHVLLDVEALTNLRSLRLNHSQYVTDKILSLVGELVGLKLLDLGGCRKVTDAGVEHLTKLTGLEVLDVSQCCDVTNDGIAHIAALRALSRLGVSTCDGTTSRAFTLAEGLAKLRRFDLHGVADVTDGVMADVERLSFRMRVYLYDAMGQRLGWLNGGLVLRGTM